MEVRLAVTADAAAACAVIRRSIIELCFADHGNDQDVLARWLRNKTPDTVASWITQSDRTILVVVDGSESLAVGGITHAGEVMLNYVSPEARFRGVSKALLRALEVRARVRGNAHCSLVSTVTAHRFYLSAGYSQTGPAFAMSGMQSYPMSKPLPALES